MDKLIDMMNEDMKKQIDEEISGLKFTKNFRSPTAEEWFVFLPSY